MNNPQTTIVFNKAFSASQLESELRQIFSRCAVQVYAGDAENAGVVNIPCNLLDVERAAIDSLIASHVPLQTVPEAIGPAQLRIALRRLHGISKTQLDGVVSAVFAQIEDEAERQDAKDLWDYASIIQRNHPLIAVAASYFNLSEAQVDEVFRQGALI